MNKNNLWVFVLFYASIERVLAYQTQNSDCLLHATILLKQEAHKQKHTQAHAQTNYQSLWSVVSHSKLAYLPEYQAFDRLLVIQKLAYLPEFDSN